jgi:cutinase
MDHHRQLRRAAVVVAGMVAATAACTTGPNTAGTPCTDVELVVVRGTYEQGPLGRRVGDPLLAATRPAVAPRTVAGHAVAYPADISLTSPAAGNRAVVAHLSTRAAECAATRFVLVGYSQGAQAMDMALGIDTTGTGAGGPPAAVMPAALEPRIAAIVLFGNPLNLVGGAIPAPYGERTLDICAPGDPVCQPGGMDVAAHLSYGGDAARAATFIASRLG